MKNKTFRKIMGAVLSLALVITGLKFGQINAHAVEGEPTRDPIVDYSSTTKTDGDVTVTKSVSFDRNGNVVVDFDIDAKSAIEKEKQSSSKGDVILVIDTSGNQKKNDTFEIEKKDAKTIATALIKSGYKVGVVPFDTYALENTLAPSSELDDVISVIDSITCVEGKPFFTNIQAGLHKADELLGDGNRNNTSIIVLSDGLANQSFRPFNTQGGKVTLYNVQQSGSGVTLLRNVTLASSFNYNTAISNASDGQLGGSYTQSRLLDADGRTYVFDKGFAKVDDEYYLISEKYRYKKDARDNDVVRTNDDLLNLNVDKNDPLMCRKINLNAGEKEPSLSKGNYSIVGEDIELNKWVYPKGLPSRGFYVNVMDTGFMTVSEAYLIKNKGTTIFTLTYPGYVNGASNIDIEKFNKKVDAIETHYLNNDNDEKLRFRRFVMVNVGSSPEEGVGGHNWFINTKDSSAINTAISGIEAKIPGASVATGNAFSLTVSDELPTYLKAYAEDGYSISNNVVSKTIDSFDEDGKASFSFIASLDKEAMAMAYRADSSIGTLTNGGSVVWIDMNKNAKVTYGGNKELKLDNPKLPFELWKAVVNYKVEKVINNTPVITDEDPAVKTLFTFESYEVKHLDKYGILDAEGRFNDARYVYPQGVGTILYPFNVDVNNEAVVNVTYLLQEYTVYFYDADGDTLIAAATEPVSDEPTVVVPVNDEENQAPSDDPVIVPPTDDPVNPGPVVEPAPEPAPEPTPAPEPAPEQAPAPEPSPAPMPTPEQAPAPEPLPAPMPTPEPAPAPVPAPAAPTVRALPDAREEAQIPELRTVGDLPEGEIIVVREVTPDAVVVTEPAEQNEENPAPIAPVKQYFVTVKYGVKLSENDILTARTLADSKAANRTTETEMNFKCVGFDMDEASAGAKKIGESSVRVSADEMLAGAVTEDKYVYARYTADEFVTVTYKEYDGEKPEGTVITFRTFPIIKGQNHAILASGPALEGYDFIGWKYANTEDADVLPSDTVLSNLNNDVVLYPVYKEVKKEEPTGDTPSGDKPSGDTPSGDTPSGNTPSGNTPSGGGPAYYPSTNPEPPVNTNPGTTPDTKPETKPETKTEPEIDMGTEGTPLGSVPTDNDVPQTVTYEGPAATKPLDIELTEDEQALGAALAKTGTIPVPVFYVTGALLTLLAGLLIFLKKRQ